MSEPPVIIGNRMAAAPLVDKIGERALDRHAVAKAVSSTVYGGSR
jgi:hypothetical protein